MSLEDEQHKKISMGIHHQAAEAAANMSLMPALGLLIDCSLRSRTGQCGIAQSRYMLQDA